VPEHHNGLSAASWAALADVDPPVVGQVLDLLGAAGVAAYAEPHGGDRGAYAEVRPPARPTLRVFVDRESLPRARDVVGAALPSLRAAFLADVAARDDRRAMAEAEVEAAWAEIVAGYGTTPDPPVGRWSALEDLPDEPAAPPPTGSGLSSRLIRRADPPGGASGQPAGAGTEDDDLDPFGDDDADDHFVPPPPPPLPQSEPVTRLAWAGLIGGPLFLILMAVLGLQLDRWWVLLAMAAFAGGFLTLVLRMKDRAPHDDGWDDGAVV
jgi:hypothetical protein